jgi:Domain of unknown function (DUF6969)
MRPCSPSRPKRAPKRRSSGRRPAAPFAGARLGEGELEIMAEAGRAVLAATRALARARHNIVSALLADAEAFYQWDHHPPGDAIDRTTGAQYFYHAHPPDPAFPEHGHFHCFMRSAAGDARPGLCHLVAISMDAAGEPTRLFTVNRWVTGESWLPAARLAPLLARFAVRRAGPSAPVDRWISGMLGLFGPQIRALQRERDRRFAAWRRRHPGQDAFEDRGLEVIGALEIAVPAQIAAVNRALARPGRQLRLTAR